MTQPYYADDAVTIWHGNALDLPLPDASVDLIVTSPPYFGLRSYQDGGAPLVGQIGSEATPTEFIDALIEATREMVRVLKPSGSIWVNLGDKYSGGNSGGRNAGFNERSGNAPGVRAQERSQVASAPVHGLPPKSLVGIPWRYALRCIDDLGLTLRAEVIWSKPNGLPESVTDRVRRSHEQWFHFTRSPRYFSAVDEIREAHSAHTLKYYGPGTMASQRPANAAGNAVNGTKNQLTSVGALGKLPGSVWEIPTQPLTVPAELGVDHFAAFPMEWPRRIIRGWSPSGICAACGEGRRLVVDRSGKTAHRPSGAERVGQRHASVSHSERERTDIGNVRTLHRIVGEECSCRDTSAPTRPAIILDPFGGTGTVGVVARALGRHAHLVELSHDYCRLAQWRVTDTGELARARQVEKPPSDEHGTDDLLSMLGVDQ